jgi:TP901 family phage tail tape measure protein
MSDAALNVRLGAKTAEFNKKMNAASRKMQKFGKSIGNIGKSMTTMFTMPLLAAGGASIKLSLDFQKSMTKIQTLVGRTGAEIEVMKAGIMDMAMETAKSPVELAEGLYFLESAGLSGANAMETLEQVAKGSASGLGDMEALSVVAAAAQNAYGEETLSASEALDKFGVMVRTGMFDAQELSNVLGKQLGLASNLGISFDEVGALISTYTQTTGDATAATNGLSAIMMTFAKLESEPTKKQAEALDAIGMSAEQVKTMMGEQGLMATMQHLQTQFEANGIPMADFFTKSQALKGALGVLGTQTEAYTDNLNAMGESTEFVNGAFSETSETEAFKMEQAMNGLKVAGTDLGNQLTPVVTMITNKIQDLTKWWGGLSDEAKTSIVKWAGWVAVAGPALMIIGKMIVFGGKAVKLWKAWSNAVKVAGGIQAWFNGILAANPIGLIITAIVAVVAAVWYFATSSSDVAITVRNAFKAAANWVIDAINGLIKGVNKLSGAIGIKAIPLMSKFKMEAKNVKTEVKDTSDEVQDLADNLESIPSPTIDIPDFDAGDDDSGGDDGGGDDTDKDLEEKQRKEEEAKRKLEEAEKKSQENIRKLKQQFNVLNESDKHKANLISLENARENELLKVEDTQYAEEEKAAINDKYNKMIETANAKAAENSKSAWEKSLKGIEQGWSSVKDVATSVVGGINDVLQAQAEQQQITLENQQEQENLDYENWYNRELEKIETKKMNKEMEEEAIAKLDDKAAKKKMDLEKKQDAESKKLQKKQAKRDKKMKIFSAIVATAEGVVRALGGSAPPANFILAGIVAGMGAMEIAAIKSTPIPMAKGGIAFGPTNALIGEYAGAKNNPEVVAPLDKLKGMLGESNQKQQVQIFGTLKGNDIFLTNDLANTHRLRYT